MSTTATLLSGVTVTGAGNGKTLNNPAGSVISFHGSVTGTGAMTASIAVEVSNDNVNWLRLGTISLSGASPQSDGFTSASSWAFTRGNVLALTGTGATVALTAGVP